ncbi:toxin C-terminal domain-containing protein [Kitasatospora aureofaciens]|uniref:polymorphic toxin-type HINT domain-containing protein n=1 Tax=Kitasatospora aureofaciens TaxID=1894 RepID=UPI001C457A32|nr:polymorphic toxin-type HINT domain-containing protein [Kitasatospora aureofaciens]MBV6702720.1 toxin C-terminal domain-containing protein [Kitasatospora aureofaciens]
MVAGTLVGSLLPTLPLAVGATAAGYTKPAAVSAEHPVKGSTGAVKGRKPDTTVSAPAAARTAWPTAGSAIVTLPAEAGAAARAGTLPVSVAPAGGGGAGGQAEVRVQDQDLARRAGISGVLLSVSSLGGGAQAKVSVDYSGFAQAAGAGFGSRLRLVQLPGCVLTTPELPECRTQTPLAGGNDPAHQTVTADAVPLSAPAPAPAGSAPATGVRTASFTTASGPAPAPASAPATVLAATATTSGPSGDYKATPLSSASTWSTSLNSGSFSWSYTMPLTAMPGGLTPSVRLSYNSGSIDGRTANTNNQASWAGDGFDYSPGFVERTYKPCADEGVKTNDQQVGDLCWATDNATISFAGHSGELIPLSTDEWRLKGDDNTKVTRIRDAARGNGAHDGEYFRAVTADGTQYYFGYNRLPNWSDGKPETKSVYTVPVYGNNSGEPCHGDDFASSWCQQGWRWNLDLVVDTHGNDITYWYTQETNNYGRNLKASDRTPYVRGGHLDHIEYGQQQSDLYSATVKPMGRVEFGTAERCLETTSGTCDPAKIDANRQYWYDTPWDLNCNTGTDCDAGRYSPAFFTRTRLTGVTAKTLQADGSYSAVDSWALTHKWGTADFDYQLLLDSIQHTGSSASPSIVLPKTSFAYKQLVNRLDRDGDGRAPFIKQRLGTITDEAGGQLDVNYSAPVCDWNSLPTPQTNTTRCFPQQYQPSNDVPVTTEWFNKYVVESVIATDRAGGAPDMVTHYTYLGDAAWHFDDEDGITKEKLKTWSHWRGYAHTRVETGGTSAMSTQAEHYFLRGMDGDRSDPVDKTLKRTVTVDDGQGNALTDDDAWDGFEYRTEQYDKPGGVILAKSVNTPWKKETAKRVRDWGTTTANLTGTSTARSFTSLDNGAGLSWRETRSNTTFDNYGRAVQVEALGDTSIGSDDQCTRITFADNTSAWILTGTIRTETVAAACAATINRETQTDGTSVVLSDVRLRYDGQGYNVAPTKGNATLTETLKSRTGTTAVYLDDAASYDVYGRGLTTTALASTSTFDTTDATNPVTTASSGARTTTTAYIPATGRPTKSVVTSPPATAGDSTTTQITTTDFDLGRGLAADSLDANNRRTDLLYDALGRALKIWLPNRSKASGQTPNHQFGYSAADGQITSVASMTLNADGSQDTAYTLYDGFGRVRQTQAPGDNGGRILSDTFYNERGQSALVYASYYATGAPAKDLFKVDDTTAVETQIATTFDGLGRVVKNTVLAGNGAGTPLATTLTEYNGDRVTVTPPQGGTPTTTITDALGRTTELRQYRAATPTGPYDSTTYGYDAAGHLTTLTNPVQTVWTWLYDQLGRQTKATDPDSGTMAKSYNDRGELVTTTDGRGKAVANVYDNLSRITETRDGSVTGPLLTSQAWDPSGNKGVLSSTTRYSTVGGATYQYKTAYSLFDALARPTRTTVTVPSVPGQEALAGSYISGTTYRLDDQPQSISYPAAGNLAAESVAFTYDLRHRPTAASGLSSYLTGQTYSLTGKPLQSTLSDGTAGKDIYVTNAYEWGTQRLASSRTDQYGIAAPARAAVYTYDQIGNVTSVTDTSRSGTDRQCFQHDYLARLTEAFTPSRDSCPAAPDGTSLGGPAAYWTSYTYNPDGTRATETRHDPTGNTGQDAVTSYTYPAATAGQPHGLNSTSTVAGAVGTPTVQSYSYDASGNTTARHLKPAANQTSDQALSWNAEGRLEQVVGTVKTTTGSTTTTTNETTDYLYDATGNRLLSHNLDTANPAAENWTLFLGTSELNLVKGAAKATATRYYPLGAATAVRTDNNKVTFQVNDHHNTAELNIDASTGAVDQRRSLPFGGSRGTTPTGWAGNRGFVGGTNEATGLVHLGARDYDSATGRFISVDPVLASGDIQSLNGYAYSDNNPLTLSDPSGLRPAGACDGPCGGGTTEYWGGGPGHWQYTIISAPDHDNNVKLQHIDFRDNENSYSVSLKVQKPKKYEWHCSRVGCGKREVRAEGGWKEALAGVGQFFVSAAETIRRTGPQFDDSKICKFAKDAASCNLGDSDPSYTTAYARFLADHGVDTNSTAFLGVYSELEAASIIATIGEASMGRPPAGCPNSFVAGTPVLLADGTTKPIEQLQVGDKVASADPESGESGGRTVDATIVTPDDTDFTVITLDDGSRLTATAHHPFWSPSENSWTLAGELKPGMALLTAAGRTARIATTQGFHQLHAAYNLTVEQLHTYYVLAGVTPVLVHNCNGDLPEGYTSSPALKGDPYHPDSVAERSAQNRELYAGSVQDRAANRGYTTRIPAQKAPFNSHGQVVFSNGKNYITPDVDSHNVTNGWKMFDRRGNRIGTYDSDLNYVKE